MAEQAWSYTNYDPGAGTWEAGYNGLLDVGAGNKESPAIPLAPGWYDVQLYGVRTGFTSGQVLTSIEGHMERDNETTWAAATRLQGPTGTGTPTPTYGWPNGGQEFVTATLTQYTDMANGVYLPGEIRVAHQDAGAAAGQGLTDFRIVIRRLKSLKR